METSAAKTPLVELLACASDLPIQGTKIGAFSLFNVTKTEVGRKTVVLLYFVLPLKSFERQVSCVQFQGVKITLVNFSSEYFGKHLNFTQKTGGGEAFEEPTMGHIIFTDKYIKEVNYKVTWIYK